MYSGGLSVQNSPEDQFRIPHTSSVCIIPFLPHRVTYSIVVSYGEKKYKCTDSVTGSMINCTFKSCYPSGLIRHRKRFHGYIPRHRRKPVAAPPPLPPTVRHRKTRTRRRKPVAVPAPLPPAYSSFILPPDSFPIREMASSLQLEVPGPGLQVPPMSSFPGSLPPCQWDGVGFWAADVESQRNVPVSYDRHGFGPADTDPTTSHASGSGYQHNMAEFHWQPPYYSHLPLDTWSPFFDYPAGWHQPPSQSQSHWQLEDSQLYQHASGW